MPLQARLEEDLKTAMKAKDQIRLDVIRMVKAAVLNKQIEVKKEPLDDADIVRLMTNLVKQRKEAVEQFQKGGRQELADKEIKEIRIIEAYLPTAVSPEEVAGIVDAVIKETGAKSAKEMGAVMKAIMARLADRTVDRKVLSDLVRSKLQG